MSGKTLKFRFFPEILAGCLEKNQKLELVNDMKYAPEKNRNVYQKKTDKLRLKNSEFFIRIKMNYGFILQKNSERNFFMSGICNISTVLYIVYVHQQTKKAIRHFSYYQ